jgi:hypothetical protein
MQAAVPSSTPAPVMPAGLVMVGECDTPTAELRAVDQRLRQTEIEHFHGPVGAQLDVGRLQVAVDDARVVRGLEGLGNLPRQRRASRAHRTDRSSRRVSARLPGF